MKKGLLFFILSIISILLFILGLVSVWLIIKYTLTSYLNLFLILMILFLCFVFIIMGIIFAVKSAKNETVFNKIKNVLCYIEVFCLTFTAVIYVVAGGTIGIWGLSDYSTEIHRRNYYGSIDLLLYDEKRRGEEIIIIGNSIHSSFEDENGDVYVKIKSLPFEEIPAVKYKPGNEYVELVLGHDDYLGIKIYSNGYGIIVNEPDIAISGTYKCYFKTNETEACELYQLAYEIYMKNKIE